MQRKTTKKFLAVSAVALLGSMAGVPAGASGTASSAGSSASDSASTSVGSFSDSFKASSNGSSKTNVAQGDYRVVEVAAVAERPGVMQLTLRPAAAGNADADTALLVPLAVLERGGVAAGQTISARERPYGIEFARGRESEAFYLVLRDDWYRELGNVPVRL